MPHFEFATGASEEPIVGFGMDPSLKFDLPFTTNVQDSTVQEGVSTTRAGFTPTAHTCANILSLPRATHHIQLPPQVSLFEIYDVAFSQPFFLRQTLISLPKKGFFTFTIRFGITRCSYSIIVGFKDCYISVVFYFETAQ